MNLHLVEVLHKNELYYEVKLNLCPCSNPLQACGIFFKAGVGIEANIFAVDDSSCLLFISA